jgi:hypothetical protein
MNIQRIETDGTYVCPSTDGYKLLLISNDPEITNDQMNRLSDAIASSPVKSVAAWGAKCSLWDDAIDWAVIASFPDGIPEERQIMTTWHEDDELPDVLNYLTHVGDDDERVHVLIVGNVLRSQFEIENMLRKDIDQP